MVWALVLEPWVGALVVVMEEVRLGEVRVIGGIGNLICPYFKRGLRYFNFYRLMEDEMLDAVAVALDGEALRWYQWENKRHPIRRWSDRVFVAEV